MIDEVNNYNVDLSVPYWRKPNIEHSNVKEANILKVYFHPVIFITRLHWNGSKRIRSSMGTERPSVYTGPVGSVPARIRYPYLFGIAFQNVPVWIRSS